MEGVEDDESGTPANRSAGGVEQAHERPAAITICADAQPMRNGFLLGVGTPTQLEDRAVAIDGVALGDAGEDERPELSERSTHQNPRTAVPSASGELPRRRCGHYSPP